MDSGQQSLLEDIPLIDEDEMMFGFLRDKVENPPEKWKKYDFTDTPKNAYCINYKHFCSFLIYV